MTGEMETSRILELVFGDDRGYIRIPWRLFCNFLSVFASELLYLGISAILASILGIIGAVYVRVNPRNGGIILIINDVWLLISISTYAIPGTVFLV